MSLWRRWLARFSYSLVLIGAVLFWEAFKQDSTLTSVRKNLAVAGGAICLGIGLAGVRQRHIMLRQSIRGERLSSPPARDDNRSGN